MKFLEGLAIVLLSLFLFLSLNIFGLALTLKCTVLSPGFVTSEIARVDASSLVDEVLRQETTGDDLSPEVRAALVDTLDKMEPVLKARLDVAVNSVYDYLLGKRPEPELASVLRESFLNPEFVTAAIEHVDIAVFAREYVNQLPPEDVPIEIEYLIPYVDVAVTELEPWLKEQVGLVTEPVADYLLGDSSSLGVSVALEPVKQTIRGPLKTAFLASPPAELAGLSPALLSQAYDDIAGGFADSLPATLDLDETELSDMPAELGEVLGEAEAALVQAREYLGLFHLYFWLLLVLILLLVAGIVFIRRQVRGASREIGIVCLTSGIPSLVGVLIARSMLAGLDLPDVPAQAQTLLNRLAGDATAPLQWYSIGLIVAGVALLVVSFVYRPASDDQTPEP